LIVGTIATPPDLLIAVAEKVNPRVDVETGARTLVGIATVPALLVAVSHAPGLNIEIEACAGRDKMQEILRQRKLEEQDN
jgi:hypothetical protein